MDGAHTLLHIGVGGSVDKNPVKILSTLAVTVPPLCLHPARKENGGEKLEMQYSRYPMCDGGGETGDCRSSSELSLGVPLCPQLQVA